MARAYWNSFATCYADAHERSAPTSQHRFAAALSGADSPNRTPLARNLSLIRRTELLSKILWSFIQLRQHNCREMAVSARSVLAALRLDRLSHGEVLEIACGSGLALAEVLHTLAPEVRVTAMDLSDAMVELARARLPGHVRVMQGDAAALPMESNSLSAAWACLVLMLAPDADAVLSELFRVLAPGARAAVSVWGRQEHSPKFTIIPTAIAQLGATPSSCNPANRSPQGCPRQPRPARRSTWSAAVYAAARHPCRATWLTCARAPDPPRLQQHCPVLPGMIARRCTGSRAAAKRNQRVHRPRVL